MAENTDLVNGAYESFGKGAVPGVVDAVDGGVQWDSTKSLPTRRFAASRTEASPS